MLFPYFWNTKTNISFSICGFDIPKIWQNFKKFLRHQGIHWVKFKVTQNDKQKSTWVFSHSIYKLWQILKHFSRTLLS